MVEYMNQVFTNIRWQVSADLENFAAFDFRSEYIIAGSGNGVSIWNFIDNPTEYSKIPIIEVASERTESIVSDVHFIDKKVFVALKNGTVMIYELKQDGLVQLSKTPDLHNKKDCNKLLFSPQLNSVITCGSDGSISHFDIDKTKRTKVKNKQIADWPIKCMDLVTPSQIICGTLQGSLIHYDLRTAEVTGTYESKGNSAITCVQRNPIVNHLVVGGNDEGFINLYDLRHPQFAVAKIPMHKAAITDLKYKPKASDTFYSSSCDNELIKLNMAADFTSVQKPKADILISEEDCFSINSFDVNQQCHLVYTTDLGAIHYHQPKKPYEPID